MARNRVIGAEGRIPWYLPEDFQWFKKTTLGGTVVMGRKTFQSLPKLLPNRTHVVISKTFQIEGVTVLRSIDELLAAFRGLPDVWIIGGAELYAQMLPWCSDLYLSVVDAEVSGDAFFPPFEDRFECLGVVDERVGFSVFHYRNKSLGSK